MINIPLDVRLLTIFEAMMTEQSVTRAARRLGLSQPAISNGLHRLRHILEDELFRRTADGMRATPRAIELAAPISQILRQMELVLQPAQFAPAESNRLFRIAISAPVAIVLLPALIRRLQREAREIRLEIQSTSNPHGASLLDSQAVDVLIGVMPGVPKRFPTRVLYKERYVGLMRSEHPLTAGKMRLRDFIAADQLLVSQTRQNYNLFDTALAKEGLKRNVILTLTDWLTASEIITHTNLVTAVFRQTAIDAVATSGGRLVIKELDIPPFDVTMNWHEVFSRHPAYEWLHEKIVECCTERGLGI
jgi:DNA-binding transcriptional LysR family regulator